MSNLPPITILQKSDTLPIFELATRTAASNERKLFQILGNSILSSVFIKGMSAGATVTVEYFQTTTGTLEEDGELQQLPTHRVFTDADVGVTNTVLVSRIHNKPQCRITITGTAEFGVYGSVRSETASDIDTALQLDDSTVELDTDKGIPFMCYDEDKGKFFFIRCDNGVLPVSVSEAGDPYQPVFTGSSTPAIEQTLIDANVPAAISRKIAKVRMVSRSHGSYYVYKNDVIIGSGRTGPAKASDEIVFTPRQIFAAGGNIKVKFTAAAGSPTQDIEAYVMGNDLDV